MVSEIFEKVRKAFMEGIKDFKARPYEDMINRGWNAADVIMHAVSICEDRTKEQDSITVRTNMSGYAPRDIITIKDRPTAEKEWIRAFNSTDRERVVSLLKEDIGTDEFPNHRASRERFITSVLIRDIMNLIGVVDEQGGINAYMIGYEMITDVSDHIHVIRYAYDHDNDKRVLTFTYNTKAAQQTEAYVKLLATCLSMSARIDKIMAVHYGMAVDGISKPPSLYYGFSADGLPRTTLGDLWLISSIDGTTPETGVEFNEELYDDFVGRFFDHRIVNDMPGVAKVYFHMRYALLVQMYRAPR